VKKMFQWLLYVIYNWRAHFVHDFCAAFHGQCSKNQAYIGYHTSVPENSNLVRRHFTLSTATTMVTSIMHQLTPNHLSCFEGHTPLKYFIAHGINTVFTKFESWNKICDKFHLLTFQRNTSAKCVCFQQWQSSKGSLKLDHYINNIDGWSQARVGTFSQQDLDPA
jgi:hypothetical protein